MAQIQAVVSHHAPKAQQKDEVQRRQLRWCYFVILTIWTLLSLVTPILVFCLTKSLYSFSLFSLIAPPIYPWYLLAKYIF